MDLGIIAIVLETTQLGQIRWLKQSTGYFKYIGGNYLSRRSECRECLAPWVAFVAVWKTIPGIRRHPYTPQPAIPHLAIP